MIDDSLFSAETLDGEEYAITPEPEHVVPDPIVRERMRSWFHDDLQDDPGSVIIVRGDTDGYSSVALLVEDVGADATILPLEPNGAYRFEHALEDLHASGLRETPIYVAGITPDSDERAENLGYLIENCDCSITWYDYAEWDDEIVQSFESNGIDVVLDPDECATSLIERERDYEYDEHFTDLAAVAKDLATDAHEDPRSERLEAFRSMADTGLYVRTVHIHGVDFPPKISEEVDAQLEHERKLEHDAVERAEHETAGEHDVAITYTRGGRSKRIGTELLNDHGADFAVVLKTDGAMGFYSHSNRETIAKCDEIAAEFGGGGRPTAAECEVPVETFRELAEYWATAGESVTDDVVAAVEAVVEPSS